MQGFEKIIELMVTIVLLFLVPIQYAGAKTDIVNQTYVMTETAYLVDSVRTTGRLTKQMYEEYQRKLGTTKQVYKVELVHYQRLLNETEEGYKSYYQGVYTEDILNTVFSEEEEYLLLPGDFFRMQINLIGPTMAERFSLFTNARKEAKEERTEVVYGGRVRNEAR